MVADWWTQRSLVVVVVPARLRGGPRQMPDARRAATSSKTLAMPLATCTLESFLKNYVGKAETM